MENYSKRINIVIGQLNGVNRMMENGEECFKVLAQLKAAKSALEAVTNKYLQEKFIQCLEGGDESKEQVCKKFFKEIIK